MKILLLILASDNQPVYIEHQKRWKKYMHSHPDVDAYFYKANPNQEEIYKLEEDTLYVKYEETFDSVYEKTILAFRFFLPIISKYDFIFRTNLSSFVILQKYVDFCSSFPKQKLCSAVIGIKDGYIRFPSGCGFTISPDVFEIIANSNAPKVIQDDITIGVILQTHGIDIQPAPRVDILNMDIYNQLALGIPSFNYHFRLKHSIRESHGIMIFDELEIMDKLIQTYYQS
jgi:hypothetical protein